MTLLLSDRALLDAFRRGEPQAVERVYREYVGQVAGLLRRGFSFMSGGQAVTFRGFHNPWDLECAVQDTFIQAFSERARQAYDGVSPFGPYLMTIARNRVISQLRSDQREQRRRSAFKAERPHQEARSPERAAMQSELQQVVEEFRNSLDDELRTFMRVRYGEERNLLDAARALGLSRMRARTRDRKLREAFVTFLRRRGYVTDTVDDIVDALLVLLTGWPR